jgi:hypothetical protein
MAQDKKTNSGWKFMEAYSGTIALNLFRRTPNAERRTSFGKLPR